MTTFLDRIFSLVRGKSEAGAIGDESPPALNPERPENPSQRAYVYVEDDGTARELEADEIEYLNTKFEGGDGNRPYIKSSYGQLTPDNRLHGYLPRTELPAGLHVKALTEFTPIENAEAAIEIAKLGIPISFCIKSGTSLQRVTDPRTGRSDFGLPGVDVRSGKFSAKLTSGVWRVVRTPHASAEAIETSCYADISAVSGRIVRYFWL
jgi:hypothetical protein